MTIEWEHYERTPAVWESWLATINKVGVLVCKVDDPQLYVFGVPTVGRLGYYIVLDCSHKDAVCLPLDRTIDEVLATAIVVARMSSPKEES